MPISLSRWGLWFLLPLLVVVWYRTYLTSSPYQHSTSYYPAIRESSIETFQSFLSNGSYTSEDLVRVFLARIEEVNGQTRAITEVNPDALQVARFLGDEREKNGPRSILHGIPILLKDSISAHGMNNTAGSYCLVGAATREEASLVTRLRKAGAIVLGKTNMSQWGNGRSSGDNASNGWSSWGGQAFGVYVAGQDPCGSSTGSATAMAMGLAAATIGAEAQHYKLCILLGADIVQTVGSITCPAMKSNLVSIKPTSALVPKDNILVGQLRGSVGPLALRVKDAAILLTHMAGKSSRDPLTKTIPFKNIPDYASACQTDALQNSRLAIPRNGLSNPIGASINSSAIMYAFEDTVELLRKNGATIIDNADYPAYEDIYGKQPQAIVSPAESKRDWAAYFSGLETNPHKLHTVDDMIMCTKTHPMEEYPARDIVNFERVQVSAAFDSPEVAAAVEHMMFLGTKGSIDGALDTANADALILPSIICSDVPGLAGYPTITVPMGYLPDDMPVRRNPRGNLVDEAPGVPFGLCFIGRAFSEERLIGLAYAYEQLTKIGSQRSPIILPRTELLDVANANTS